jgi:hypothetical protein
VFVFNTRPCPGDTVVTLHGVSHRSLLQRRKMNLKAKFENGPSYISFKRFVPGAFNVNFRGSTCTALPCGWPS